MMQVRSAVFACALVLACQNEKPQPAPAASVSTHVQTKTPAPSSKTIANHEKAAVPPTPPNASAAVDDFVPDMPRSPPPPTARPNTEEGPERNRSIISEYGFPGYPGLVHLCGKRVYQAAGGHLTWDAFLSADAPAKVLEHFKSKLTERGFAEDKGGGTWRLPPQSPVPNRVLTVMRATDAGPHRGCDEVPSKDARSVIFMSRQR